MKAESLYWIELLEGAEIFRPELLHDLTQETNELLAILTTCVKRRKQLRSKK